MCAERYQRESWPEAAAQPTIHHPQQISFLLVNRKKKLREIEKEQDSQRTKPFSFGPRPGDRVSVTKPDNASLTLTLPSFSFIFFFPLLCGGSSLCFSAFPFAFLLWLSAARTSFSSATKAQVYQKIVSHCGGQRAEKIREKEALLIIFHGSQLPHQMLKCLSESGKHI